MIRLKGTNAASDRLAESGATRDFASDPRALLPLTERRLETPYRNRLCRWRFSIWHTFLSTEIRSHCAPPGNDRSRNRYIDALTTVTMAARLARRFRRRTGLPGSPVQQREKVVHAVAQPARLLQQWCHVLLVE